MSGLTNEWVDEWMSEGIVEWLNDWVNEWLSERVIRRTNDWVNEWACERVEESTNDWVNEWVSERVEEWTNDWMNEGVSERRSEWTYKWMNECVSEQMSGRVNEWTFISLSFSYVEKSLARKNALHTSFALCYSFSSISFYVFLAMTGLYKRGWLCLMSLFTVFFIFIFSCK